MKKIVFIVSAVVIAITIFQTGNRNIPSKKSPLQSESGKKTETGAPLFSVVAKGLDTPWGIAFLPDKSMLVTERPGRVRLIDKNGVLDPTPIETLLNVKEIGEGGLLGITLHPDFETNHYVYFYYTYEGDENKTFNRVVRMKYENGKLSDEQVIVDKIPGAPNHNGGRIKFGPDKLLYITTGDAQNPSQAQDTNAFAGKILRVTNDGKPAAGNPFNNLVYSYGHRNPQGLAWDKNGQFFATEHGRSGVLSGLDEFNKIEKGKNYGWPVIQGDEKKSGMETPVLNSGPTTTWAPAGMAYVNGIFFFGGLRGKALYSVTFDNSKPVLREYFKNQFGRIRDVILGPDNMIYITTSNRDGRGIPKNNDDQIIKIDLKKL